MGENTDIDYDALASRLTDPKIPLGSPVQVLTGKRASNFGHDLLLREYGSDEAIDTAMRRGRPSVGSAKRGASPVVRGVIPLNEFEAFKKLEQTTGLRQSELVRKAVHDLLVAENLVS